MSLKTALVIIPTYNEAENIKPLLLSIIATLHEVTGYSVDILVVDDYSPDGTGTIVQKLAQKHRNIQLLSGKKAGLGDAYIRGLRYGLDQPKYDAFVMMDADFSHSPSYIPRLLRTLDQGYDYVIGSRYIPGGAIPDDWSILRILNSKVANLLARTFAGIGRTVYDATSGYKAIRTSSLQTIDLDNLRVSGYFFQVALTYAFNSKSKLQITEIPIAFENRKNGASKIGVKDVVEFVYCAYTLNPQSSARTFVRFCVVGISGVVVNLGTLTVLVRYFHISPLLGGAIAIETSIASNFLLNHVYTFRNDTGSSRQRLIHRFSKFNATSLTGAAISFAVFSVLYKFIGLQYIIADALAIIPSVCFNYWASSTFVWKDRH